MDMLCLKIASFKHNLGASFKIVRSKTVQNCLSWCRSGRIKWSNEKNIGDRL